MMFIILLFDISAGIPISVPGVKRKQEARCKVKITNDLNSFLRENTHPGLGMVISTLSH